MSLFREIMYANAPIIKYQNEFFGDYKDLNNVNCPSAQEIHNYQLKKLMDFQVKSIKNSEKAKKLNMFLLLNGQLKNGNEYDKIVDEHINNLFYQINELIRSGAMSKETRQTLSNQQQLDDKIVQQLYSLAKELNTLRNDINGTITSSYINKLDNLVNALPGGNIDEVLRTLYHLKGDILEETGVEWINQRIPSDLKISTKAYSTGSLRGKNGQIIQDILIVDMDQVNLMDDINIDFKLGDKNYSLPLKKFLRMTEKYTGSKQITINSEAEDILSSISLMGVQAKSGYNQLPWNTSSKNTWANLTDAKLNGDDNVGLYIDFLEHLQKLQNTWDINQKNIKKQSPVYTAMANYSLATQLDKVLHLSQVHNQYVLTPNGFVPFIDRILELYEKRGGGKYYFSFKGKISMTAGEDIISKSRPVILGV